MKTEKGPREQRETLSHHRVLRLHVGCSGWRSVSPTFLLAPLFPVLETESFLKAIPSQLPCKSPGLTKAVVLRLQKRMVVASRVRRFVSLVDTLHQLRTSQLCSSSLTPCVGTEGAEAASGSQDQQTDGIKGSHDREDP